MRIIRHWHTLAATPELHGGAITIGNFDGVHTGHQQILAELIGHALALHGPSLVVTFEPHPRAILYPEEAPRRLCHLHEKLELIASSGIDAVFLLHFDLALAQWSAERFIRTLHSALRFRHVHVGYDFAFGHMRAGHAALLRNLGEEMGFTVSEAAPFEMHGAVVSSSRIRSAIEAADFDLAKALLGRPYTISGHVGKGAKRGRKLGFPTANLSLKDLVHPPPGVYAVYAHTKEKHWNGAAYLGYRPTFAGRTLMLEVHVFDDEPELYKKRLMVEFVARIREDRAFRSSKELIEQIKRDCQKARRILDGRDNA